MSRQNDVFGEPNERQYTEHLSCSANTKKLLMNDCKALYLKYHPELEGAHITQGHILKQVVLFYLKE